MGKWLALLADEILQTPSCGTTKTPKTPVVWVLSVPDEGVLEKSRPVEAAAHAARTCADCQHLLRSGTCSEPVAAGLLTAEEGFGIAWPPEGHGAGCAGYSGKTPAKTPARPYRLAREQADAAHAKPWDEAAIARFQARQAQIMRLGYGQRDADDLAERLHLRDAEGDDRAMCLECQHYRPGRCGNHARAGLHSADVGRDLAAMLQRCPAFVPSVTTQ